MKLNLFLAATLALVTTLPAEAGVTSKRGTCRRALKAVLRDPDSLKIPLGGITERGNLVTIQYRARNGFGGMNSSTFYCEYDKNDNLIDVENF